jgi:hypothetical protein
MADPVAAARYRARQFFAMLKPRVSAADRALVESVFESNRAALALFERMRPADQQHAIAVLRTVRQQTAIHPALAQAALLHDVGKGLGQPLFYRVAIVLLNHFWPAGLARLAQGSLTGPRWRRPFVVHARHPEIGADWAEAAGCEPLTVELIRRHQQPPAKPATTLFDQLHQALVEADDRN